MKPYKDSVTIEQYENAIRLANFLIKGELSGKFDMYTIVDVNAYKNKKHICGTVGCALGYFPEANPHINYANYYNGRYLFQNISEELMGINCFDNTFEWCFSSDWKYTDNTPLGAGKRIKILYEEGLPHNWKQQLLKVSLLSY